MGRYLELKDKHTHKQNNLNEARKFTIGCRGDCGGVNELVGLYEGSIVSEFILRRCLGSGALNASDDGSLLELSVSS